MAMEIVNNAASRRGRKYKEWVRSVKVRFMKMVSSSGLIDWDDEVWRLNDRRKAYSYSDGKFSVEFYIFNRFVRRRGAPVRLLSLKDDFLDLAKALVFLKIEKHNWNISAAALEATVQATCYLLLAVDSTYGEHPFDVTGLHFDEVQRLLLEGVRRRERHVVQQGVEPRSKVSRVDERGEIRIPHASAAKITSELRQIASVLGKVIGVGDLTFTNQIPFDHRLWDSRSINREAERKALFPDLEAIYFLADLSIRRSELTRYDRLMLCVFELMLVADKRIGEVLSLAEDSLVERNGVLGLRYIPKKRALPWITWIPEHSEGVSDMRRLAHETDEEWTSARKIFLRAFNEIKDITAPSRAHARVLESTKCISDVPFPSPRNSWPKDIDDWVVTGLPEGVALGDCYRTAELSHLHVWLFSTPSLPKYKFKLVSRPIGSFVPGETSQFFARNFDGGRVVVPVDAIKAFILNRYRTRRLVYVDRNTGKELLLSDALFCVDEELTHSNGRKRYYPHPKPLPKMSLAGWLSGREDSGCPSIFARYGRPDLAKLTPHMTRRLNTTQMRLAGVGSIYIARQAGRSLRHVDAYDYIDDTEMMRLSQGKLHSEVIHEADYLVSMVDALEGSSIPMKSISEFLTSQVKGRNKTKFGSCSHEYSIAPCPAFKACYMGCAEYWIAKGDASQRRQHANDYAETLRALVLARDALGESFYASHYVVQYSAQLITLRRILDIHSDPRIPDGEMIKPAPSRAVPNQETLRALFEDEGAIAEAIASVDELLRNGYEESSKTA